MVSAQSEGSFIYKVVSNQEEQYFLWLAARAVLSGWNEAGKSGVKRECLDYIDQVWTDMRPLSLRQKMAESNR